MPKKSISKFILSRINHAEESIKLYEDRLLLLQSIQMRTKKDGKPFKDLSRNFYIKGLEDKNLVDVQNGPHLHVVIKIGFSDRQRLPLKTNKFVDETYYSYKQANTASEVMDIIQNDFIPETKSLIADARNAIACYKSAQFTKIVNNLADALAELEKFGQDHKDEIGPNMFKYLRDYDISEIKTKIELELKLPG